MNAAVQDSQGSMTSDYQSNRFVDRISKTFNKYFSKKKKSNKKNNQPSSNSSVDESIDRMEISPTETVNMNALEYEENKALRQYLIREGGLQNSSQSTKSVESDIALDSNKTLLKQIRKSNEELWDAAESGDYQRVFELLDTSRQKYPAEINAKSLDDWTALHMASNYGHFNVAKILLNNKANIEAKTTMERTPLHLSCMRGHFELVKLLLSYKANVNAADQELNTPLHYASEHGFPDIVSYLLDKKPEISAKNSANLTCIDIATSVEIRKIFENKGFSNENMINNFGRAYMDDAVLYNGRADLVGKLLIMGKQKKEFIQQQQKQSIKDEASIKSESVNEQKPQVQPKEQESAIEKIVSNEQPEKEEQSLVKEKLEAKEQPDPKSPEKSQEKFEVKTEKNPRESSPVKSPTKEITFSNIKIETFSKNDPKPLSPTEIIGPASFLRHDTLGKGSFGEVFLVEKVSDKKLYAMKALRKDKILNNNLTRYAKTERNVLSVMDHPFIVKLHYSFQTETKLYLVLEYCPGGDLGNLLYLKKKLPEHVARIYAAEVTLALEALHNKDIIFRDLKPDNVVLDKDGHALLTDFGLSKEGMKAGLANSFCGSIAYFAPEMLSRAGHTKTVDWYLLGVLIYEMLVGIPPYYAKDRNQLYENIRKGDLRLPKSLSEEARSILILLLKRDPTKRLGHLQDAREIKAHPWFKSINWDDALARKLNPPPLDLNPPELNKLINPKIENGKNEKTNRNIIEGWSFIKQ